jgi:hypothetical protein
MMVHEEGFETSSSEFRTALYAALRKLLSKSLDFSAALPFVKRDLVDKEAAGLKTLGVAWSYQFVSERLGGARLLGFGEEENKFEEIQEISTALVIKRI